MLIKQSIKKQIFMIFSPHRFFGQMCMLFKQRDIIWLRNRLNGNIFKCQYQLISHQTLTHWKGYISDGWVITVDQFTLSLTHPWHRSILIGIQRESVNIVCWCWPNSSCNPWWHKAADPNDSMLDTTCQWRSSLGLPEAVHARTTLLFLSDCGFLH